MFVSALGRRTGRRQELASEPDANGFELVRQLVTPHTNRGQFIVANLARDVRPVQTVLLILKHADDRTLERIFLRVGNPSALRLFQRVLRRFRSPTISAAKSTADIISTTDQTSRCCRSQSRNAAIVTRGDGRSFGSTDSATCHRRSSLRAFGHVSKSAFMSNTEPALFPELKTSQDLWSRRSGSSMRDGESRFIADAAVHREDATQGITEGGKSRYACLSLRAVREFIATPACATPALPALDTAASIALSKIRRISDCWAGVYDPHGF